ncbi:MAG TPA: pilus assembly protein PilM, partial [candidate division Zixibacteria bacterium]|nr:pilus assembly protein PilM [candidate division Zixibacteria bacterium]
AGDTFTESIAKALSLEFKEAEEIKRELGLDGEAYKGALKRAFLPVLNSLVTEIKNTIRFYEEHTDHERKISRVLLSGSSSKLKHLPSFLHEKLSQQQDGEHVLRSMSGLRVELGNPWVNILKKSEMPPLSREDSLSFATAIGLAMRGAEE